MIRGAIASLVTPFTPECGLDTAALARLSERMSGAGFDALCFAGGTGEFLSLSDTERETGLQAVVDGSNGTPVVASALFTDPRKMLLNAERFADIGAKALMIMPPYFYAQTQEAMFQHLSQVGKASPLPVVLFNSAGRAGRVMTPETVLRLAESTSNIIGVKETTECIQDIERLVAGSPDWFNVIQAHEPLVLASYAVGADGSFGSLCNIIPHTIVALHRAIGAANFTLARRLSHQIGKIAEIAYSATIPVGIKYIMNSIGVLQSGVRPPLSLALDRALAAKLDTILPEIERVESI